MATMSVEIAERIDPKAMNVFGLLSRCIRERTGIMVSKGNGGNVRVFLDIAPGIGAEGFKIEDGPAGMIRIVGNDVRGLVAGVGKFLRGARCEPGFFKPGRWRGASVPKLPVRGMYFATHFHNFYHDAPIEDVIRYVEELALWGCNMLSVWFDMHHYSGIDDPAAVAMLDRLRRILLAANAVGMGGALTMLANEAFSTSPKELRADWTAGHDGYTSPPAAHYHVEICPNKPSGLNFILKWRRQVLDAFAGVDLECVWLWPYDQGGCTCSQCSPWGTNGFMSCSKAVAKLICEKFPNAKIVFSTWYFDHFIAGEWAGLTRAFATGRPDWIDYLMIDDFGGFPKYPLEHGIPGKLPAIGFPEISMEGMCPWGGFGANPRPGHWQRYWDVAGKMLQGGYPYSEGIFEDINKAIMLQLYWSPGRKVDDILREYVAYEYSQDATEEIVEVVKQMEDGLDRRCKPGKDFIDIGEFPPKGLLYGRMENGQMRPIETDGADKRLAVLTRTNVKMTEAAKNAWRWRILWLRAALDAELTKSGGCATETSEKYFLELQDIYHANHAIFVVAPPACRALRRLWQAPSSNVPEQQ